MFPIVRDEHTNIWRAVRSSPGDHRVLDPYDAAYREKWKDGPPLIPSRMISRFSMEDRGKGIPRNMSLNTGWKSLWRSSKGDSPQGDHYHLGWIDEQIENEQFYLELVRGLVSVGEPPHHQPRGIWSATPQTTNPQLWELRETADAGSEGISAYKLLIDDNPFIPEEEKLVFYESLPEDEREVRYFGNYAFLGRRVYPGYNVMGAHGCEPFEIPPDWARYVCVDPGRQHCGTLFLAVDPEEAHVWIYDGFDLRNADATRWAAEVKRRQGDIRFESFVIDQQMGQQTRPGGAKNPAELYYDALVGEDVFPKTAGPMGGFFPGTNQISAREEAVLHWMSIRGSGPFSGTAKLQVFRGCIPELDRQVKIAHMDTKRADKRAKVPEDILVCMEYLAGFDPTYREPEVIEDPKALTVFDRYQEKKKAASNRRMHRPSVSIS